MKCLLLLALVCTSAIKADSYAGESRNYALHAITAFAATQTLYLILGKTKRLTRTDSFVLSGGLVMMAGLIKEVALDASPSGRDLIANTIGIGAAGAGIAVFGF